MFIPQNIWQCVKTLVPLVNIKIAGKWMFIPLKMVCIGIDPSPYGNNGFSPIPTSMISMRADAKFLLGCCRVTSIHQLNSLAHVPTKMPTVRLRSKQGEPGLGQDSTKRDTTLSLTGILNLALPCFILSLLPLALKKQCLHNPSYLSLIIWSS